MSLSSLRGQTLLVLGCIATAAIVSACGDDEPLAPVRAPRPGTSTSPRGSAESTSTNTKADAGGCGGVSITPWTPAESFGEFQAEAGTGAQGPIEVVPSCPARSITVTIYDPDFAGNALLAYDDDVEIGRVSFADDGVPGALTTDTETFTAPDGKSITRIELVAAPNDYVSWGGLVIDP